MLHRAKYVVCTLVFGWTQVEVASNLRLHLVLPLTFVELEALPYAVVGIARVKPKEQFGIVVLYRKFQKVINGLLQLREKPLDHLLYLRTHQGILREGEGAYTHWLAIPVADGNYPPYSLADILGTMCQVGVNATDAELEIVCRLPFLGGWWMPSIAHL